MADLTWLEYACPELYLQPLQSFSGALVQGLPEGSGDARFVGGATYSGMFHRGMLSGQGKYCWPSGVTYVGTFVDNTVTGQGTIVWPDGSRYQGDVVQGLRHGMGKFQAGTRQAMYTGAWVRGQRHGRGEMHYDPQTTYLGDWQHNRRHGTGRMTYRSGNTYEGAWRSDERNGRGRMVWMDRHEAYTGDFVDGQPHGQGEYLYMPARMPGTQYYSRNRYVGSFNRGVRHGAGRFYFADGSLFDGEYVNNAKHGPATFTYPNGVVYTGEFANDAMVGAELPHCHDELWPVLPNLPDLSHTSSTTAPAALAGAVEREVAQVVHVALRHIGDLRTIYAFYSRLGMAAADNIFVLSRIQLHQALVDFKLQQNYKLDLSRVDEICAPVLPQPATLHDAIPFRDFVNSLILLGAYLHGAEFQGQPFAAALCLERLIEGSVLPHACNVQGVLYAGPCLSAAVLRHAPRFADLHSRYRRGNAPLTALQGLNAVRATLGSQAPSAEVLLELLATHVTPLVQHEGEYDLSHSLSVAQLATLVCGALHLALTSAAATASPPPPASIPAAVTITACEEEEVAALDDNHAGQPGDSAALQLADRVVESPAAARVLAALATLFAV